MTASVQSLFERAHRPSCVAILASLFVVPAVRTSHAATVGTLPYRGELSEGGAKFTGKRALRLTVKTHPTTGQVVFRQSFSSVEFNGGRFAVALGACSATSPCVNSDSASATPTTLAAVLATRPASLYVNVEFGDREDIAGSTFTAMPAWQRITSAPFALEAPKAILGRWRTQLSRCGDVSADASSVLNVAVPLTQPAVLSVRYRARHNVGSIAVTSVSTNDGTGAVVREKRAFLKQSGDESAPSTFWTVDGSSSFDVTQPKTLTVRVSIQNTGGNATVQACPSSASDPSAFIEVTAYAK
jgi:hypothetical protein